MTERRKRKIFRISFNELESDSSSREVTYMAATWNGAERCEDGKQLESGLTSAIAPPAISNNQAIYIESKNDNGGGKDGRGSR